MVSRKKKKKQIERKLIDEMERGEKTVFLNPYNEILNLLFVQLAHRNRSKQQAYIPK